MIFFFWVQLTVPSKPAHVSKVLFFTQIKVWIPFTPLKTISRRYVMSFDNKIVMTMFFGNGCSTKITHNIATVM